MCPVCTVTVIAGLGISRLLGIDDLITAIWIGGLIFSLSFFSIDWIKKKWPKFKLKYYYFPTFILMYLFVFIPFKLNGTIGIVRNTMWGVDKIILGIIIGSAALLLGVLTDKYQRVKFKKIFFPFQKVFFPVLALIITSLIFYLITAG